MRKFSRTDWITIVCAILGATIPVIAVGMAYQRVVDVQTVQTDNQAQMKGDVALLTGKVVEHGETLARIEGYLKGMSRRAANP